MGQYGSDLEWSQKQKSRVKKLRTKNFYQDVLYIRKILYQIQPDENLKCISFNITHIKTYRTKKTSYSSNIQKRSMIHMGNKYGSLSYGDGFLSCK